MYRQNSLKRKILSIQSCYFPVKYVKYVFTFLHDKIFLYIAPLNILSKFYLKWNRLKNEKRYIFDMQKLEYLFRNAQEKSSFMSINHF